MENLGIDGLQAVGPMREWPLGRLFAAAARLSGPVVWRIVEQHGVSPAGYFLLRELIVEDGLRPSEIARRMLVTPATVTSIVDTLERNGHVRRERSYRDRRGVMLRITDAGRQVLAEKSGPITRDLGRLYDFVDEADEAVIRRFLLDLINSFENHSTEEDHSGCEEAKGDGA